MLIPTSEQIVAPTPTLDQVLVKDSGTRPGLSRRGDARVTVMDRGRGRPTASGDTAVRSRVVIGRVTDQAAIGTVVQKLHADPAVRDIEVHTVASVGYEGC